MRAIQFRDAICEAMSEEMRRVESVLLLWEEIAKYNGANKALRKGMAYEYVF
jgi:pyruvate dehydrogenase E1 component beta subunit